MIQLTSKTSVALLLTLMKQNYGKAWTTNKIEDGFITVGIHAPTGEVAYKIPEEYIPYINGMIQLDNPDVLGTAFSNDSAERLLEWTKQS